VHSEDRAAILSAVAEQMISLRTTRGLDLELVAQLAHLDAERLAEAEDGAVALNEEELQSLADVYEVGVTAFFGGRVTPVSYLFGV
jgi:transcriptional regulator with XRE-family HTH domain